MRKEGIFRKGLAVILTAAMVLSASVVGNNTTVRAAAITIGSTDLNIDVDGTKTNGTENSWNSTGSAHPFTVKSGYETQVEWNNNGNAKTTREKQWDNFVVETKEGTYKGVTMRGDAYGWVYGNGNAVKNASGAEIGGFNAAAPLTNAFATNDVDDWAKYTELTADCKCKLVATVSNNNTIEFAITAFNETISYNVTYTLVYENGLPEEGIQFYVGADGAKITLTKETYLYDVDYYKSATPAYPEAEGTIFSGWYSDSDCTTVYQGEGGAYAKFVDESYLMDAESSVKVQTKKNDTSTYRIMIGLESLNYTNIGFKVQYGDTTIDTKDVYDDNLTTAYTSIIADDETLTPKHNDLWGSETKAQYIVPCVVKGITDNTKTFKVTPYWTTEDGTKVVGATRVIHE